jgi:hypothetical protein
MIKINQTAREGKTVVALYKCNCKKGQKSTNIKMVKRGSREFPKCNYCHRFVGIQTKFIEI